jgi:hypothetical protein
MALMPGKCILPRFTYQQPIPFLLAPDIVMSIFEHWLPEGVSLFDLAVDVPVG